MRCSVVNGVVVDNLASPFWHPPPAAGALGQIGEGASGEFHLPPELELQKKVEDVNFRPRRHAFCVANLFVHNED